MAIIHIAGYLPIHVDVTPWWAFTYSFSTLAVPGSYSFTLDGAVDTSAEVSMTNEMGEPPYAVTGYIQETKRTAEGKVTYSFISKAKNSNVNTKIADIAPPATLKRDGTTYTLITDSVEWETISLTTASGVAYTMAAWNVYGDLYIIANGVKVTSGTDADGNTITEASYLEYGQSWTLDLAANLPEKTLYEAVSPYYIASGQRLMYDEGNVSKVYFVLDGGDMALSPIGSDFFLKNINIISLARVTDGGCACAEDIEVGAYKYPTRIGYVAYAEGWTDPLMGWKRENGTAAQCIVSIGVNGMATTGNYLDDEGKPYTGLVYKTRPEPTQSPAFVEQFARLKTARSCTFSSVQSLNYMTPYVIGEYIGYITHKKRDGRRWTYEAEIYSPLTSGEVLTPSTMIFPLYGGTKGVAAISDNASLWNGNNGWGDYTSSLVSTGIVTTGYLTFTPNCLTIARTLNIRAQYVDDPDKVLMGIAAPICKTTTTSLNSILGIKATAYGAAMNATTYTTKIIDASEGVTYIEIKVGTITATAPQSAIYWFAWAPRYYDSSTATPSVSVMFGPPYNQGITQKRAWAHCFAVVFVGSGTEITREDITPSDTDTYQSYTLWTVPIGMAQLGGRVTTFLVRLNVDATKGTTGIVGEQFRVGFGSMSPLPYSE